MRETYLHSKQILIKFQKWYEKEKSESKRKNRKTIIVKVALAVIAVFVIGWFIYENKSIQTAVYEVSVGTENADMDGFTIVQISDLHNAKFGAEQARLLKAVTEQEPDMIAVTGDLVDSSHTDIDAAMDFMSGRVLFNAR